MATTVYHYPNCSTCKKALKWLAAKGVTVVTIDIVKNPPDLETLRVLWRRSGLPLKKFFNTSGQSYRGGGFKDRLSSMTETEQLEALAADGKLIKRPICVSEDAVLVGFKEAQYATAFGG